MNTSLSNDVKHAIADHPALALSNRVALGSTSRTWRRLVDEVHAAPKYHGLRALLRVLKAGSPFWGEFKVWFGEDMYSVVRTDLPGAVVLDSCHGTTQRPSRDMTSKQAFDYLADVATRRQASRVSFNTMNYGHRGAILLSPQDVAAVRRLLVSDVSPTITIPRTSDNPHTSLWYRANRRAGGGFRLEVVGTGDAFGVDIDHLLSIIQKDGAYFKMRVHPP